MTILVTALTFIIILSILVVVHEWGHFVVARIFGIRVDEFSMGFGPRTIRVGKRGDTEYNIRWIPLGGYVKIAGMDPDEEPILRARDKVLGRDKERETSTSDDKAPDQAEDEVQVLQDTVDGFYTKPLWQRSLVIFAGPFMSFMLGFVVFCLMGFVVGWPRMIDTVHGVIKGSVAEKIGLLPGDQITRVNNIVVTSTLLGDDHMVDIIHGSPNKAVTLTILRNGKTLTLTGVPQPTNVGGQTIGLLGFEADPVPNEELPREHQSLPTSVKTGVLVTAGWFRTIWQLIASHRFHEIRSTAGGPIMIVEVTAQAVKHGVFDVTDELAELSLSLALFNLLPIPILDGGHLLEFAIEKVRSGRRMTPEQKQSFMLAGLAVIGILFVLIMFNDILRTIHHGLPQ